MPMEVGDRPLLAMRHFYARIPVLDRACYLGEVVRLAEALHYSERMKRAGVPDKVRRKILRGWRPFVYHARRELADLVADMRRRAV